MGKEKWEWNGKSIKALDVALGKLEYNFGCIICFTFTFCHTLYKTSEIYCVSFLFLWEGF